MLKVNVLVTCICMSFCANAQVGIGTDLPDKSAALDIRADNLGLLIPRVSLLGKDDIITILSPANSLIVYNLESAGTLSPGYHYWDADQQAWIRLLDSETVGSYWSVLGNSSTQANTHFIGTTDDVDLVFKRNNVTSGLLNNKEFNTSFGVDAYKGVRDIFPFRARYPQGYYNTAVGYSSLNMNMHFYFHPVPKPEHASHNTALGALSLTMNRHGMYNVAMGSSAMEKNREGDRNVAIGYKALSGGGNPSNNVAVGAYALAASVHLEYNVALGSYSMRNTASGNLNTAVGYRSLYSNSNGSRNVALGAHALENNNVGLGNTAVGYQSMLENIAGNNNTAIGYMAGPDRDNLENTTAIGYEAVVTQSNSIRLGNASITSISSYAPLSVTSDRRYKELIKSIPFGLEFIKKLNPVEYVRKNSSLKNKEWGLIAQELQATLASMGYMNAAIVHADDSKEKMLSVRYTELIAPIIKSIQELSAENKRLKEMAQKQQEEEDKLARELRDLKNSIHQLLVKSD